MEEQLKANLLLMAANEKTFEEKLAEAKALQLARAKNQQEEKQIDKTKPYLMNLNEDPLLSGKVLHSLDRGTHQIYFSQITLSQLELIRIGKKNGNPVPEVVLGGISIKPNHAQITNKEGKITIAPCDVTFCFQKYFITFRLNVENSYSLTDKKFNKKQSYSIMIELLLEQMQSSY